MLGVILQLYLLMLFVKYRLETPVKQRHDKKRLIVKTWCFNFRRQLRKFQDLFRFFLISVIKQSLENGFGFPLLL